MDLILVQMEIARGKPALNRAKVQALTGNLKPDRAGTGLVVLPELFSTGYIVQGDLGAADAWMTAAGEDREFLSQLARRLNCWVAGTTLEVGDGPEPRFRNLSLIYNPAGEAQVRYQKVHPFSFGGEDLIFARGREIVTFDLGPWQVQPTVCYDLRFPELYRTGSSRGVHLILVQANWPEARQLHWDTLLRARAIENQAFVAGVNCVGHQDKLLYGGGSVIYSPKGEPLALGGAEEGLVKATLDQDYLKQWRKQFPALRDRLPWDFYRS
jgi:omega-amidase